MDVSQETYPVPDMAMRIFLDGGMIEVGKSHLPIIRSFDCAQGLSASLPPEGCPILRDLFIEEFARRSGFRMDTEDVIVVDDATTGAMQFALARILGDRVEAMENRNSSASIPIVYCATPCWNGMEMLADSTDCGMLLGETTRTLGYQPTASILESTLDMMESDGTPVDSIFLCNFSTPTGAELSEDRLREIGEVVRKHPNIMVFEDWIFWANAYRNATFATMAEVCPDLWDARRIVGLASLTKGWGLGSDSFFEEEAPGFIAIKGGLSDEQLVAIEAPSVATQIAARDALGAEGLEINAQIRSNVEANAQCLADAMRDGSLPGMSFIWEPTGGTNAYLDISAYMGRTNPALRTGEIPIVIKSAAHFVLLLSRDAQVVCDEGARFFGNAFTMRINLARATPDVFSSGIHRLSRFIHELV